MATSRYSWRRRARHAAVFLTVAAMAGVLQSCRAPAPVEEARVSPVAATRGAATQPARAAIDQYYLSTCAVCEGTLGAKGEAPESVHEDRHLRFCTPACADRFHADRDAVLACLDRRLIEDQRAWYPTSRSLIDGRSLGDQPVDFILGNRLFRAADERDKSSILADPAAAVRALDRAVVEAQRPIYGMPDKCPVQGDILENEARIDVVVANRMIRVCCERCVRVVKSRPYQYLAMVEYSNREARERGAGGRRAD